MQITYQTDCFKNIPIIVIIHIHYGELNIKLQVKSTIKLFQNTNLDESKIKG